MTAAGPDDDELLVEPSRLPSWALATTVALVIGVLVVAAIRLNSAPRTRASSPDRPVIAPPSSASEFRLDQTGEPVVDAVVTGGQLTVLRTNSLLAATPAGRVLVNRHLTGDSTLAEAPTVRLFVDPARHDGWAVSILERRARVMMFDPATLQPRQVFDENFIVYDAALLDGRVYAATGDGIAWIGDGGGSGRVANVSGTVASIAADPVRHRLLAVLGTASGNPLVSVTPAGHVTAVAELDVTQAQVRVVAGTVWVAGSSTHGGAAVEKLDPLTLRRLLREPDTNSLAPAAVLLGARAQSLFVGSGTELPVVWCVNATTGVRAQVFDVAPVSVVSAGRTVVAIVDQQLLPLRLNRACAG